MNRMLSAALAAATMAGVSAPVHATYVCDYAKQTVGRVDGNPVVASAIGLNDGYTKWSVHHQLADGKIVDRSTQYDLTNRSDGTTIKWSGRHLRHLNLWMEGVWRQVSATHAVYTETLHDDDKNKIVEQDVAECDKYVAPSAAVQYTPPPPVQYTPPAPVAAADSVHFVLNPAYQIIVKVTMGGMFVDMQLDTGANISSVGEDLASRLIAGGFATEAGMGDVELADGSKISQRYISIRTVSVGSHAVHDVRTAVVKDGTTMLLGLPVLDAIGKFSIDSANLQLTFG